MDAAALRRGPPRAVRTALLATRERTLRLAEDFRAALGPQPRLPYAAESNPPLWELGHVAWFQEWWVLRQPRRALGLRAPVDGERPPSCLPQADGWYDSSRVAHRTRWELPLPDAEGTLAYLRQTLERTLQALDELPADAGADALYFFRLAVLHEAMHAEAAAMMAQAAGIPLRETQTPPAVQRGEITVPAARVVLGESVEGFAFDNELGAHAVDLAAFTIDAAPVAWSAFLPFVDAGGYEDERWWTPAGRAWLRALPRRQPLHLERRGANWTCRRGGAWQPLDPAHAAVHLGAHEAEAWCRWTGRRLPAEAEWQAAALSQPGFRWGHAWEWTATDFGPWPGFEAHPYRDYSAPWFGSRRVLRGASPATSACLAHVRYRNFFEPHRRDVFAGFRSVRLA